MVPVHFTVINKLESMGIGNKNENPGHCMVRNFSVISIQLLPHQVLPRLFLSDKKASPKGRLAVVCYPFQK